MTVKYQKRFTNSSRAFRWVLSIVCLTLICLALPRIGLSATYYVDPQTGADKNPGTSQSAPWAHIPGDPSGGTFPTINAGDTINIKSGSTFNLTGQLTIDGSHYSGGTASAPITIQRSTTWGSGNVVFNGSGASLGSWSPLIWVNKVNYMTLDGATPQGFDVQNSPVYGFEADGASESNQLTGLTVKNMRVFSAAKFSFILQCVSNFYVANVECDGNSVANNGGFTTGGPGYRCTQGIYYNCVAHHIGNAPGTQEGGTNVNIGFWLNNSKNIAYVGCQAYVTTGRGFDNGNADPTNSAVGSDNILFMNCSATQGFAGFGAVGSDASGSGRHRYYFINCLSYNNASGSWFYNGATVYMINCVWASNNGPGMYVFQYDSISSSSPQLELYIVNSILYHNGGEEYSWANPLWSTNPWKTYSDYNLFDQAGGSEPLAYYNYGAGSGGPTTGSSYKLYYSTNASQNIAAWRALTGYDTNSNDNVYNGKHANFTNASAYNFTLASNSNAIGAGVNMVANPPTYLPDNVFATIQSIWGLAPVDFNNNPRPTTEAWDIGVYNYNTTVVSDSSPFTVAALSNAATTATPGDPAPADSGSSGSGGGGGGGGCFIATAAFGSYLSPQVMVLRNFRDRHLLTNRVGTAFVHLYYRLSPPIAAYIGAHESLRAITRYALTPIVYSVKYPTMLLLVFPFLGTIGYGLARRRHNMEV